MAIQHGKGGWATPAREAMARNLSTVQVKDGAAALEPLFRKGHVAIVMDGAQFLGLITPIDLLQYLRRQTGVA